MRKELEAKLLDAPCPKYNTHALKLTGFSGWQENQENTFQGFREYECINCGQKFKAHFVTLHG